MHGVNVHYEYYNDFHVRVTMFVYLRVRVLSLLRGMYTSSMKRDSEYMMEK